jgi:ribonuclease HI
LVIARRTNFVDCAALPKFPIVLALNSPMNVATPQYMLAAETNQGKQPGHWRFVLRQVDGHAVVDITDVEPDVFGERLDLLTVVRALEWLDQPSHVTLVGCTRYVEQGIRFGVSEWRDNGWRWERFGQMSPVRDIDLWQRMDRALQFHQVDCGQRRFDGAHDGPLSGPHWNTGWNGENQSNSTDAKNWVEYSMAHATVCRVYFTELASCLWQMVIGNRRPGSGFSSVG